MVRHPSPPQKLEKSTFKPLETLNPSSRTIVSRKIIFLRSRGLKQARTVFVYMFFICIKYRFFKWPYLDKYEDLEGRPGTDRHLFSSPIVLDRFWAPLLSADAGF